MKKILTLLLFLAALCASAQETFTPEEFLRRYTNLTERVGADGVGVETLLNKWEAAYPDDVQQMLARFGFCFARCQHSRVVQMSQDRYLGREPILPMTDSLGNKANWFEVIDFDDELYAQANLAIDKAIAARPNQLDWRFAKIDAMLSYEQGSPEMTLQQLKALADRHYTQHPAWEYTGLGAVDEDQFKAFLQDYCAVLFRLGTEPSAEAFRSLSEYLLQYSKNDPLFLDNLGSYYLVKKDYKKARKYFDKVLASHPSDMVALKNCLLLARSKKDVKLEKKYLALMAQNGETETDRASAQARLDGLSKKR